MTDSDFNTLIEALEKGEATEEQQRLAAELLEKWVEKLYEPKE